MLCQSVFSSEDGDSMVLQILASTNESTWCKSPEEQNQYPHCFENLKSLVLSAYHTYFF